MKSSVWICVCVKTHTLTLKSMPTVEMKLPARKAPSLKRTSRQVFPTPESPTSITWDTHTQREASSNWINVLHSPLVFTLVGTFEESIRIKWQTNCGSVNVMDSRSSEGHETGSLKNTLERSRNLNESGEVKKVKHFFVVFLGQGPQTSSSGATSRLK